MRIVGFLACLLGLAFVPFASTARACGASSCAWKCFCLEGNLPANAPGVLWEPGHALDATGDTEADQLEWTCATGDEAPRPIAFHAESPDPTRTFERLLVPDEPLVVGDRCEIAPSFESCGVGGDGSDGDAPHLSSRASFTITEPAPLPTVLGMVRAQLATIAPVGLSTINGDCSIAPEVCGSRIELELSDDAAPWADVLRYDTRVDGEGWYASSSLAVPDVTGGSYKGRGVDLIFVATDETESSGLDREGAFSVVMRATVPGASSAIEAPAVTIDLTCASTEPLQDAGSPDPVEEPTRADSGPAPSGEDASTPADDDSLPATEPAGAPVDSRPTVVARSRATAR